MDTPHLHSATEAPPAVTPGDSRQAWHEEQGWESPPRYCPTGLLATFALFMAGRGRCVNTDVMLGDREYAMWQLACARATDDPQLGAIAQRLLAYFDDPQHSATPMLGTA